MIYVISDQNSALKEKILSIITLDIKEIKYDEVIQEKSTQLILVIDRNLEAYKDVIIKNIRASQYVIGIWSSTALTNYLPKEIKDLLDSLLCEDNIFLISSLIESHKTVIQLPDCSEEKFRDITRVNCITGKKL